MLDVLIATEFPLLLGLSTDQRKEMDSGYACIVLSELLTNTSSGTTLSNRVCAYL